MKYAKSQVRDNKPRTWQFFWVSLLIALPITGILLSVIPPDLRLWTENFGQERLEAPYRYPFSPPPQDSNVSLQKEITFYQERIGRDPQGGLELADLANAYLKMARVSGQSDWYLLAEQTAQRSLVNLPVYNESAILVLARVAEARHDFAQTIRLAEQVLRSQPGDEGALSVLVTANLASGKVKEAAQIADTLVNQIPSLSTLTLRAQVKVAQGQDRAAIKDFQQALVFEEAGETSASAWTRTLLGRFHARRGHLSLAGKLYREALRIQPQYPLTLVQLAELETRLGQYRAAEDRYSQVLAISKAPSQTFDHVVLRGKARVKNLQGDRTGAEQLWNQAETLLRQDTSLGSFGHKRELARLLLERDRTQDLAEALTLIQAEVQIRPDAETLDTLAWVLSRQGRWREAQQAMREALRWGIRDAGMFYRAGTIEKALGNSSQALAYFQMAQETDPKFDEQARRTAGLGLAAVSTAQ